MRNNACRTINYSPSQVSWMTSRAGKTPVNFSTTTLSQDGLGKCRICRVNHRNGDGRGHSDVTVQAREISRRLYDHLANALYSKPKF
jgi:hypothetical protein